MRGLAGIVVLVCLLVPAGAAPAAKPKPKPPGAGTVALRAIDRLASRGGVDGVTAAGYRAVVERTAELVKRVPPARARLLAAQLHQAAEIAAKLTAPRAAAIFGQLTANDDWLATKGPPHAETDVTDADGVVYRFFPGRGFEFHPLANFGALNAAVAAGDNDATRRLADALAARGVPRAGGGSGWEYYFDYAGGKAPWLSGMAQAVAAQAFVRASALLGDETLLADARAAYRTIPGRLDRQSEAGLWIKLYSFNRAVVLNAQLQTILSLKTYADATGDSGAAGLAAELQNAAAAALPRFDTGYWSYYALPRDPSPFDYHDYVVQLLRKLGPADPRFAEAATRFSAYETQPPAFRLADAGPGAVRFWVSKPSLVTVAALGSARRLSAGGGWEQVSWKLPKRSGLWQVTVSAKDAAGNTTRIEALPIVHVAAPARAKTPRARDVTAAGAESPEPGLLLGAGVDSAAQARLAQQNGFGAVRYSVTWPAGAAAPDPAVLAPLQGTPAGERVLLELVADPMPTDDAGRAALASYAEALVQGLPGTHDLLLGPAPQPATSAAYAAAFTEVETAVKSVAPSLVMGAELDGAASPKATLAALARAAAPAPDELAFQPAPARAGGAWTLADGDALRSALADTFPGATVPVLASLPERTTAIPAAKAALYASPLPAGGVTEPAQALAYNGDLSGLGCRPSIAGVLLPRLVDSPTPGDQGGLYYPDSTPKASLAPVRAALATAGGAATSVCPGVGVPAEASSLNFPPALSPRVRPSVSLGCLRDCLYLLTLERVGTGMPVLAARGSLRAGVTATIRLPRAAPPSGSFRLQLRLVAQTNPGPLVVQSSPVLTSGA